MHNHRDSRWLSTATADDYDYGQRIWRLANVNDKIYISMIDVVFINIDVSSHLSAYNKDIYNIRNLFVL